MDRETCPMVQPRESEKLKTILKEELVKFLKAVVYIPTITIPKLGKEGTSTYSNR